MQCLFFSALPSGSTHPELHIVKLRTGRNFLLWGSAQVIPIPCRHLFYIIIFEYFVWWFNIEYPQIQLRCGPQSCQKLSSPMISYKPNKPMLHFTSIHFPLIRGAPPMCQILTWRCGKLCPFRWVEGPAAISGGGFGRQPLVKVTGSET